MGRKHTHPLRTQRQNKQTKQKKTHKKQDHSVSFQTPKYETLSLSCRLLTPYKKNHLSPYFLQCWYLKIRLASVSTKIMQENYDFSTTYRLTVDSDIWSFLSFKYLLHFFLNEPVFPKAGLPYKPLNKLFSSLSLSVTVTCLSVPISWSYKLN